ncbi:MAG: ABC transporter ATP-binding protein [Dermatophilaceae bacterium]
MRILPVADPGVADARSPGRFLWWMAKGQRATLAGGMFFGIGWMSCQAIFPAALGRAIDRGVAARDSAELLRWGALMLLIGLVQAVSGILRHRFAVTNWLTAAYRTLQLTGRHAVHLGGTLPRKVSTGEVVAIGVSDIEHIGGVMDVSARFSGAVVSFTMVAIILVNSSLTLGLVVLIGVPLLSLLVGPLLAPLQRRAAHLRGLTGELANTASDIIGGLRVLRGIGGEQVFSAKYRSQSQRVRRSGIEVARLQSVLDALQVLLPGIFVVVVVWLGARYAATGRITVGELVAFYGYSAFLMLPLRTTTEFATRAIRAWVAATRVCRLLGVQPDIVDPQLPEASPLPGSELVDARSGLRVRPGTLLALVTERTDDAARLADRLGRCGAEDGSDDGERDDQRDDRRDDQAHAVRLGGVPLPMLPRHEVRTRIVVSDTASALFAGTLAEALHPHARPDSPRGRVAERIAERISGALTAASADDVVAGLPDGLRSQVAERGRTFSGGQRQRLVLARALLTDPEILILVEPTSAVDAHTEARIARSLREYRAGRTTVVTTSSPLVLDEVDEVAYLVDGEVVATGTHAALLAIDPAYRALVTRGGDGEIQRVGEHVRDSAHGSAHELVTWPPHAGSRS